MQVPAARSKMWHQSVKNTKTLSERAKSAMFQHFAGGKPRETTLGGFKNTRQPDFPTNFHMEKEKTQRSCGPDLGTRYCGWNVQKYCKNQHFSIIFDGTAASLAVWKYRKTIRNSYNCAAFPDAHFDTRLTVSKSILADVLTGSWDTKSNSYTAWGRLQTASCDV